MAHRVRCQRSCNERPSACNEAVRFWRMSAPALPGALSKQRAALSLAIGVAGIAWSAILVRWSGVSGLVSAFYRLAFAALVFVPWMLLSKRRRTAPISPGARRAAIIAGVLFGADL